MLPLPEATGINYIASACREIYAEVKKMIALWRHMYITTVRASLDAAFLR